MVTVGEEKAILLDYFKISFGDDCDSQPMKKRPSHIYSIFSPPTF